MNVVRHIANQKGALTLDFLFAFMLVGGLSMVVMAFSVTLATVEVAQYIAFASARTFLAGNVDEASQTQAAFGKFLELKNSPIAGPLLNSGWFALPDDTFVARSNMGAQPGFQNYTSQEPSFNFFHGVVFNFRASILDFQNPFFGGTKMQDDKVDTTQGFTTNITAFLGREPTHNECLGFMNARMQYIRKLPNTLGAANYSAVKDSDYFAILDNGC